MFHVVHKHGFAYLGATASFMRPFRIEGKSHIRIGEKSFFQRGAWLFCAPLDGENPELEIGDRCVFGYNNHISCIRHVVIGDDILTANNVYISDNIHGYENIDQPVLAQGVIFKKAVHIGSGSWIGENAAIIGVNIGKNCVIGANAVVTRDIPDYSVAAGVPARIIRQYDTVAKRWVECK